MSDPTISSDPNEQRNAIHDAQDLGEDGPPEQTSCDTIIGNPPFNGVVAAGNIERARVPHPFWQPILDKLDYCLKWSQGATDPYCMMILGESGVGKSAIVERFVELHPPEVTKEGRRVPVLWVTTPSVPTVKALVEALIIALLGRIPAKGTAEEQTARLLNFLRVAGVKMIIIDEFQHVVEHGRAKFQQETSDWLKNLISQSGIPVVIVGMPSSVKILENPQLRRRFMTKAWVRSFEWEEDSLNRFSTFLSGLDEALPFKKKAGLGDREMTRRLFFAGDGRLGNVMKTVRFAAHMAEEKKKARVTPILLARAYKSTVTDRKRVNPFLAEYPLIEAAILESLSKQKSRSKKVADHKKGPKPLTASDVLRP